MKIFETKRTFLRTFKDSDLMNLKELHFDENVMRFLGGGVRTEIECVREDLQKYIEHQNKYGFSKWAIIHKNTNAFIGRAGLIKVPESKEIDLGYALHQKYWKQGYASEIASSLFDIALKYTKISDIIGIVIPGHEASIRVLEKIGFSRSGTGHYFGMDVDVYRPHVHIKTVSASESADVVDAFYISTGRPSKVDQDDTVVIAEIGGSIVGVVRLCFENGIFGLRTMQIDPKLQGHQIGSKILIEFESLLRKMEVRETFCFCYAHLEKFYGQIGFKKINFQDAPLFLQERLKDTLKKNPDLSYILMIR